MKCRSIKLFCSHLLLHVSFFILTCYFNFIESQDFVLLLDEEIPEFAESIPNITVPVGRDAQLPCVVDNLGSYRAAWLRVEDKGILTIHQHIITRNYRVSLTHSDNRYFVLHIKNIHESDRGGYMCQINTVPMRSQVGFLDVVVPPDIEESSSDVVATEGSNVTLHCKAKGYPSPSVKWKREDNLDIPLQTSKNRKYSVQNITGESLEITRITRIHMGAYLCIASNGVPPSVSRRILLHVHFPPVLWIPNPSMGVTLNRDVTLDCHIEAYPSSSNYWLKEGEAVVPTEKYEIKVERRSYKTHLKLLIRNFNNNDFGSYKCLAKNPLGSQERDIKVFDIGSSSSRTSLNMNLNLNLRKQSDVQKERSHQLEDFNDNQSPSKVPVNQQRAMYSGSNFMGEPPEHESKPSTSSSPSSPALSLSPSLSGFFPTLPHHQTTTPMLFLIAFRTVLLLILEIGF